MHAHLAAVSYHLPERIVTNEELGAENPGWDMERLAAKVGILARHIAGPAETAGDLGYAAAAKLLDAIDLPRAEIDTLLFCTQTPDFLLPATACVLQDRLGLGTNCAALDFNQGCSGYIYGLHLAKALVASGEATNVLLVTAETYSKHIHPRDRSVRVLFGDGASASLITREPRGARIGATVLGTDGAGYRHLIVPAGGARRPRDAGTSLETTDDNGSVRSPEHLFMDGQELFLFTLKRIPPLVAATLARASLSLEQVDCFVFHQANAFMNEHLRAKLKIERPRAPLFVETIGNTVSSTIPIALHESGRNLRPGDRVMLVGFGVGYSWGACMLEWGPTTFV